MPRVRKHLLAPGTYWTRKGPYTVSRADLEEMRATGESMLADGLAVPVPLEHQDAARPLSRADALAHSVSHNTGWLAGYHLDGDNLYVDLDVDWLPEAASPEDIEHRLSRTIRYVSPRIEPAFRAGNGKTYRNAVTHVALTPVPVWSAQQPFGGDGAALMSLESVPGLGELTEPVNLSLANAVDFGWTRAQTRTGKPKWVGHAEHAGQTRYQPNEPGTRKGKTKPQATPDTPSDDPEKERRIREYQAKVGRGERLFEETPPKKGKPQPKPKPEAKPKPSAAAKPKKASVTEAARAAAAKGGGLGPDVLAQLAKHRPAQLDANEITAANRTLATLRRHHGEHVAARIGMLATEDAKALADLTAGLPARGKHNAEALTKRLRGYGHMLQTLGVKIPAALAAGQQEQAKAEAPAAPPKAKEPHEMTREEFHEYAKAKLPDSHWGHFPLNRESRQSEFRVTALVAHDKHVKAALAAGKPVPPEVLKDYPDLAPQPKAEPAKKRSIDELATKATRIKAGNDDRIFWPAAGMFGDDDDKELSMKKPPDDDADDNLYGDLEENDDAGDDDATPGDPPTGKQGGGCHRLMADANRVLSKLKPPIHVAPAGDAETFLEHLVTAVENHVGMADHEEDEDEDNDLDNETGTPKEEPMMVSMSHGDNARVAQLERALADERRDKLVARIDAAVSKGQMKPERADKCKTLLGDNAVSLSLVTAPDDGKLVRVLAQVEAAEDTPAGTYWSGEQRAVLELSQGGTIIDPPDGLWPVKEDKVITEIIANMVKA